MAGIILGPGSRRTSTQVARVNLRNSTKETIKTIARRRRHVRERATTFNLKARALVASSSTSRTTLGKCMMNASRCYELLILAMDHGTGATDWCVFRRALVLASTTTISARSRRIQFPARADERGKKWKKKKESASRYFRWRESVVERQETIILVERFRTEEENNVPVSMVTGTGTNQTGRFHTTDHWRSFRAFPKSVWYSKFRSVGNVEKVYESNFYQ